MSDSIWTPKVGDAVYRPGCHDPTRPIVPLYIVKAYPPRVVVTAAGPRAIDEPQYDCALSPGGRVVIMAVRSRIAPWGGEGTYDEHGGRT